MDGKVTNEDLYALIQGIAEQNRQIKEHQLQTCQDIKEEIRSVQSELLNEIRDLREENKQLKDANSKLHDRLERAENKLRKFNLIAYGAPETSTEIDDIQAFLNIINNSLKVDCRFEDIRDIYRIGKVKQGSCRPLFVEFINYKLKLEVLKNAKALKGTGIFLSNDFTPEEQQRRKFLREALKLAQDNNYQATIKKNILYVNSRAYTYEELKNQNPTFLNSNPPKTVQDLEKNNCNQNNKQTSYEEQPSAVEPTSLQSETRTPVTTDHPFEFHTELSSKKRKIAGVETDQQNNKRTTRSNVRNN